MNDLKGSKAVSLLRVSGKKQGTKLDNDEIDIPEQRKIIDEFITQNKMTLIKEFIEGGISAFKLKPSERDALQTIKAMALNKQFDTLIVYNSDRIGRIADESPAVIRFLNEQGIRVWSYTEGEIKTNTHIDKLITYIQFWRNEEDSLKLSKRASDYQIQMIKDGRYRGGNRPPYGYKLVDNGTLNHKGRKILDLEINKEEAKIVELIYNLSINHNMGGKRITKYLNEKSILTRNKKQWNYSTIRDILNNPTYKGCLHMYSSLYDKQYMSKQIKKFIIIPEDKWELNQMRLKSRTNSHNNTRNNPAPTSSRILLSGITYCGHCGSKMGAWANHSQRKNTKGEIKKRIYDTYRCRGKKYAREKKCNGQTTYSARKIDKDVEEQVKSFVLNLSKNQLSKEFKKQLNDNIGKIQIKIDKKNKEIDEINKQIGVLKNEIPKALLGESKFDEDLLQELFNEKLKESKKTQKELSELEIGLQNAKQIKKQHITTSEELKEWNDIYDKAPLSKKKMLIAEIVESVHLYRDKIKVKFKIDSNLYETYVV